MAPQTMGAGLAILVVVPGAVFTVRKFVRRRPDAAEIERLRRQKLCRTGKMCNGEIIDADPSAVSIAYSYTVSGVLYTAWQDLTALRAAIPANAMTMVGPVSVRFDPRNPANSMVLCEEWSGLRRRG